MAQQTNAVIGSDGKRLPVLCAHCKQQAVTVLAACPMCGAEWTFMRSLFDERGRVFAVQCYNLKSPING